LSGGGPATWVARGYVLRKPKSDLAPIILGLVLGPIIETSVKRGPAVCAVSRRIPPG